MQFWTALTTVLRTTVLHCDVADMPYCRFCTTNHWSGAENAGYGATKRTKKSDEGVERWAAVLKTNAGELWAWGREAGSERWAEITEIGFNAERKTARSASLQCSSVQDKFSAHQGILCTICAVGSANCEVVKYKMCSSSSQIWTSVNYSLANPTKQFTNPIQSNS